MRLVAGRALPHKPFAREANQEASDVREAEVHDLADIFNEVDEDLRREKYERIWKRYGGYIIAACVLAVLGAAGSVGWRTWRAHERRAASFAFQSIVHSGEDLDTGPTGAARAKALADIAGKLTPGYQVLAKLQQAASLVRARQNDDAVRLYRQIAQDSSAPKGLRDVAALKAAYLQADELTLAAMKARIARLTVPESGFRFSANEILGYVALRTGDNETALGYFQSVLSDPAAPETLRARVADLAGLATERQQASPASMAKQESSAPAKTGAPADSTQ